MNVIIILLRKYKKVGKYFGNVWWTVECEQAVMKKKETQKHWLRDKTSENFTNMKDEKMYSNIIYQSASEKCLLCRFLQE